MSDMDYTTLAGYLACVADPRDGRGLGYEWHYLLLLIAAAMMTGESTLVGISQWVQAHQAELLAALQPRCRRTPSLVTCGGYCAVCTSGNWKLPSVRISRHWSRRLAAPGPSSPSKEKCCAGRRWMARPCAAPPPMALWCIW